MSSKRRDHQGNKFCITHRASIRGDSQLSLSDLLLTALLVTAHIAKSEATHFDDAESDSEHVVPSQMTQN